MKNIKIEWVLFGIGYVIMCLLFVRSSFALGEYSVQYFFWAGLAIVISRLIFKKKVK